LILLFLLAGCAFSVPAKGQYQGDITIDSNGTINPSTAPIQQVGALYLLTSDIYGSITVNTNNLVLDGNGHDVICTGSGQDIIAITLNDVSNDTVENFSLSGGWFGIAFSGNSCTISDNSISGTGNGIQVYNSQTAGISVTGDSNIITGNNLESNYDGIVFNGGENNLIVENIIEGSANPYGESSYGLMFWGSSNNTIYHNYFENNVVQAADSSCDSPFPVNTWDDGYPKGGNYWSDYQTKYPDAKDIGDTGIGNIPYVIDGDNVDHYPLMNIALPLSNQQPDSTPTLTPTPTPTASVPELPPLALLTLIIATSIFAVFIYRKKAEDKPSARISVH